MVEQAG